MNIDHTKLFNQFLYENRENNCDAIHTRPSGILTTTYLRYAAVRRVTMETNRLNYSHLTESMM